MKNILAGDTVLNKHYYIVFHLVGEEKVPNMLGVMQIKSDKHIFIKSNNYPADYIKFILHNEIYDENV